MKKLIKFLLHRSILIALIMLVQLLLLMAIIWEFSNYFVYFQTFFLVLGLLVVGFLLYSNYSNPTYKMAWVIIILVVPVFGSIFYFVFGRGHLTKREKREMELITRKTEEAFEYHLPALRNMKFKSKTAAAQSRYITDYALSPPHKATQSIYFPIGEKFFASLIEELKKAQNYIFMEYFIIEPGVMWNTILEVLKEKAANGVDVRFIYDDMGCITKIPHNYYKTLRSYGIKCYAFNPFRPILSSRFNNRDHRKITVIDGMVGFTGGINLADEYINAKMVHGHWKDSAIMLKGEGVFNLTVMFLSLWMYLSGKDEDFTSFRADAFEYQPDVDDGYVQPYSDSPLDNEAVGQNVYLNLINRAKHYVYITTPYLVIDSEMAQALCLAAKGGIDVRIITPHIPDKRYVFTVTRAYYEPLMEAGVKIYEYTPGFMHAKNFVADDLYGIVGTINLDFRSLYLHFECGAWLYGTKSVLDIKQDYLETLAKCHQMTLEETRAVRWYTRLIRMLLRAFSPLM